MTTKYLLSEEQIPRFWYNILADVKTPPAPVLHPGTKQPVGPQDLAPLFPMALIEQEMSAQREIPIPDEVRSALALWRPSPLFRAHGLERALKTRSHIYYKYEGVSPSGSHKPNTAVPQAYYNAKEGVKRLATETGAGQWGSSLSFACKLFGIECEVFMVKLSHEGKPYRKIMMNTWGATVHASASNLTNAGRSILAKDPNSPGSLGIAISEAVEVAATHDDTKYSLGSVLNHVLMHQTVIGLEALKQMEKAGDYPDIIIAPFGGGSNFAGIAFPFLQNKLTGGKDVRAIAVEPTSCPKLTRGVFRYDFGDTVGMTPLIPMYTLGHNFIPSPIHAGGLRYHGAGAIVSQLLKDGIIEADAINQIECFDAGILFSGTEGIIPAPEANHAIAEVIRQAKQADAEGISKTILFNLCGHGHFDLSAYEQYLNDKLIDFEVSQEEINKSLAELNTPII